MKSIENGLKRFEKGTKIKNGKIMLKGTRVPKNERTPMAVIYERLKNNLNNEIVNGVKFSKEECNALGLDCYNDFAYYCLDRLIHNNSRVFVYIK